MKRFRFRNLVLILTILTLVFSSNISVNAERVKGNGSLRIGNDTKRSYYYEDTTVNPPLGYSWRYSASNAPLNKGLTLTNYRVYFGSGRTINGFNDQRVATNSSSPIFKAGNPFQHTYSSSFGTVSTAVQLHSQSGQLALFFGTSDGRIGRVSGIGNDDYGGNQSLNMSEPIPNLGKVEEIVQHNIGERILAISNSRLVNFDYVNNKAIWYYPLSDKTPTPGKFSGITNFSSPGDPSSSKVMIVSDNGADEGWGFIYDDINSTYRSGWQRPPIQISYSAGIPKHAAYDYDTKQVYAIDKEGRFYVHNEDGIRSYNPYYYAGDSTSRGYDSVGGVLLTDKYAFVSTLGSSQGTTNRGTITRFNKTNPSQKNAYVHESAITTTPVYVSGLVYFGDENGKVWALNPDTMSIVNWYLDETITSPRAWYDIGSSVLYILGADNHLIASSDTDVFGFKGRPDFVVSSIQDDNGSDLNGKRYNFTATIPKISFTNNINNIGTFDYGIYDDFGGVNHQKSIFSIKNLDNNSTLPIDVNNVISSNIAPSIYKSIKHPNDPLYFQVGVGVNATQSYQFQPQTEGKYQVNVIVDSENEQKEFEENNNSKSATIDVVDMRKPTANSNKSVYKVGETVNFSLTKTQIYSYSSYEFQMVAPNGSIVYSSNGSAFPGTLSTSNTQQVGQYKYKVDILNRYGDRISSDWKTFTVSNNPPNADFVTDLTSYNIEQSIKVTNKATDPDGDTLSVKYDVTYPDGSMNTFNTENPVISSLLRGIYSIKQTVTDPYGLSDTITKTVNVVNRLPKAGFNTNKTSYYNNETVSVVTTATDPDGDVLSHNYEITRPDGTKLTSSIANPSFGGLQIGTYSIKQTVADGYGGSDTITKTIQVVNRPPIPGFTTDKTSYKDNETVKIISSASDPDNQTLTYLYEITRPDGTKFTSTAANPSFGSLQIGTYTIKQTVTDPFNASASVSKTINVGISNLPPVAGFNFDKSKYYKNQTVNIISTATDPNGDPLTYLYEITRPDGTKFTSTAENPSFQATMMGTYSVKQTVTDPSGATDSIAKTQWVQTLPTPGFNTNKTVYNKNEAVAITSTAFDEDGGTLTYLYEVTDPNGVKKTYTVSNPTFPVTNLVGTFTIKQTVTDDEGDSASITKSIQVVNRPPIADFSFDKTKYYKNEVISLVNNASDPDGDSLSYLYEVTKPNGTKVNFNTSSPSFKADLVGTYTVKQTVTDPQNATASVTKTQWVQSLPTPGFTTDKTQYVRGETAKITGNAYDEDGGTVTYSYLITSPSGATEVKAGQNPTFSISEVGNYSIKQTVTDDEGDTATLTKSVQSQNRPPAAGFNFDKAKYYKSETIKLTPTASDPDGDLLSYQYEVTKPNGTKVNFNTSSPSFKADLVGTYTVKQTVTDTFNASSTVTKTQWVQSLPTPGFTTDKTQYIRGETVKITGNAYDEDGGNVTYSYLITSPSGATQTKTGQSPDFVVSEVGNYTIKQTVTDDEGDIATLSKSIQVINQSPKAGFSFDKSKYYEGDIVKVSSTASDPEGDTLKHKYEVTSPDGTVTQFTTPDFSYKAEKPGLYTFKQTVTDSYNSSDTISKEITVYTLVIEGMVYHTPKWEEIHEKLNSPSNIFYSGEKFLVSASVTDHPIEYVEVDFRGYQVNNTELTISEALVSQHPVYTGEIYSTSMADPNTKLKEGTVYFLFTAKWKNGVTKTDLISVNVIDSIYQVFDFHRTN
ncbi:hypothetical protein KM915_20805 [Cytobacillus oceanisediminis]|uniref:Ig-like domain-containing protein n=1 Tax=Cytobacillus oceanisediminis TaxID=665099 RepID=UPI001C2343B0|nr:CARDB domain-containing protein [Cytobacillus oceanisediminis]MBU8732491.1 hypothetical protein [Cytobacillus oceanisediminis]